MSLPWGLVEDSRKLMPTPLLNFHPFLPSCACPSCAETQMLFHTGAHYAWEIHTKQISLPRLTRFLNLTLSLFLLLQVCTSRLHSQCEGFARGEHHQVSRSGICKLHRCSGSIECHPQFEWLESCWQAPPRKFADCTRQSLSLARIFLEFRISTNHTHI